MTRERNFRRRKIRRGGRPILRAIIFCDTGMAPHSGWQKKPERPRCTWLRDVLKAVHLTARDSEGLDSGWWSGGVESASVYRRLRVLMIMMMYVVCNITSLRKMIAMDLHFNVFTCWLMLLMQEYITLPFRWRGCRALECRIHSRRVITFHADESAPLRQVRTIYPWASIPPFSLEQVSPYLKVRRRERGTVGVERVENGEGVFSPQRTRGSGRS